MPTQISPTDLTSWTSHPPFVASASSESGGGNYAWRAFTLASPDWAVQSAAASHWLKIDLGTAQTAFSYSVKASPGNYAFTPTTWTMQGSNDNSAWTTVDTRTGVAAWTASELRTYTCSVSTTAYRYFRVLITTPTTPSIGQLILYGATLTAQTITFAALADRLASAAPFTVTATASSGLPVTFAIAGPATLAGSVVTLTGSVGSVTITASQAGNGTYAPAANVVRSFAVTASVITERGGITYDQIRRADRSNAGSKFLMLLAGSGTPNGVVVGSPGDIYVSTAGGAGVTLWVKESGVATSSGWVSK